MRLIALICSPLVLIWGCAAPEAAGDPQASRLITVTQHHDRPGTFSIGAMGPSGITLPQLTQALRTHQHNHPGCSYEILAEMKTTPAVQAAVQKAFADAGVRLVHYWVPVSDLTSSEPPGKYGPGYIDLQISEPGSDFQIRGAKNESWSLAPFTVARR